MQKECADRRFVGVHYHLCPADGQVSEDTDRNRKRSLIALLIRPIPSRGNEYFALGISVNYGIVISKSVFVRIIQEIAGRKI